MQIYKQLLKSYGKNSRPAFFRTQCSTVTYKSVQLERPMR